MDFIIKHNEFLAEQRKKTKLVDYCQNLRIETIFVNTAKNSETNETHKFVLNLSQRLDLRSSDKHVVLQKLSIHYMWKNIIQH